MLNKWRLKELEFEVRVMLDTVGVKNTRQARIVWTLQYFNGTGKTIDPGALVGFGGHEDRVYETGEAFAGLDTEIQVQGILERVTERYIEHGLSKARGYFCFRTKADAATALQEAKEAYERYVLDGTLPERVQWAQVTVPAVLDSKGRICCINDLDTQRRCGPEFHDLNTHGLPGGPVPVPAGFVHVDQSKPLPPAYDGNTAWTWIGSWKPALNGIGCHEVVMPDPELDYDSENYELVPASLRKDTEAYVSGDNKIVKGLKLWVRFDKLTEYAQQNLHLFPLRVPKQKKIGNLIYTYVCIKPFPLMDKENENWYDVGDHVLGVNNDVLGVFTIEECHVAFLPQRVDGHVWEGQCINADALLKRGFFKKTEIVPVAHPAYAAFHAAMLETNDRFKDRLTHSAYREELSNKLQDIVSSLPEPLKGGNT